jgi:uncharacterized membrane protein YfcA
MVMALVLALLVCSATAVFASDQVDPATTFSPITFSLVLLVVTTIIGVVAVLGGTGGGVIFTPLMMGLTPIDSYIVRATGLLVALAGSLIAARPFLHKGLANIKLLLIAAVPYTIFAVIGSLMAVYIKNTMGDTGEALIRLILGILVVGIAFLIIFGGKRVEYPEVKKIDRLSERLAVGTMYWEESLKHAISYKIARVPVGLVLFCFVGMISGLFGVGAGWAMVPVLNMTMFAPLKIAAASSKVLIGLGDTGAVWPYLLNGGIFPLFAIPSMVGLVVGTSIGAKIMPRVNASFVRWLVIGIMFASGGKLLYDGIMKLTG